RSLFERKEEILDKEDNQEEEKENSLIKEHLEEVKDFSHEIVEVNSEIHHVKRNPVMRRSENFQKLFMKVLKKKSLKQTEEIEKKSLLDFYQRYSIRKVSKKSKVNLSYNNNR